MKSETRKFIKNLTLKTPLSEVREHCKTDKDSLLIMNHLYKLMAKEPSVELNKDLRYTFACEKINTEEIDTEKIKITEQQWKEILDSYHNYKTEEEKLKAFQKIVQVIEGYVQVQREKIKEDPDVERKLFLKAKVLFKDIPKEQLKTSLIQRKMQIGYGKAVRIRDFLIGVEK